jgi:hypothetical protein
VSQSYDEQPTEATPELTTPEAGDELVAEEAPAPEVAADTLPAPEVAADTLPAPAD